MTEPNADNEYAEHWGSVSDWVADAATGDLDEITDRIVWLERDLLRARAQLADLRERYASQGDLEAVERISRHLEIERLRAELADRDAQIAEALGIIERGSGHLFDRGTEDAAWGGRVLQGVAAALSIPVPQTGDQNA